MANVINMGGSGANIESKTVKSSQSYQTITPPDGVDGFNPIIVSPFTLQTKIVDPSIGKQVVVKPDTGKDGMDQVLVNSIKLQSKSVSPSTSQQVIKPDSYYHGLSQVTVNGVSLQSKQVGVTNGYRELYPDSGYLGFSDVGIDTRLGNSQTATSNNPVNIISSYSFHKNSDWISWVSIKFGSGVNLNTDLVAIGVLFTNQSGIQSNVTGVWVPNLFVNGVTGFGISFMYADTMDTVQRDPENQLDTLRVYSGMRGEETITSLTVTVYKPITT